MSASGVGRLKPSESVDRSTATLGAGRTKTFRRHSDAPRLTPDQKKRQSDVLRSAWRYFGEAGPVIAFLNNKHDQLHGQPLHLAVESDEGLMRVERLLEAMKA
jgi:hypothetical protein